MKGIYIGLNLWTSGVDRDLYKFYLMFLSSEIDIKLCQIYTKIYIFDICIKISLNRSYSANTQPIWKRRYHKELVFEFNNFSFLINIIGNIIISSMSRDKNSHQWQGCMIVTWYRRRHIYLFKQIFISISRDRNIRIVSYWSQSTPEVLRFQPIPHFIFPLQSR